ncbi:MAG: class I SAM-dependent methyltransferase [Saprospiraceae bacterium]|nr:class I SAM-dependent methyltransferase [Saprospiraceae bacterium]
MDTRMQSTLARLHQAANREILTIAKGLAKGIFRPLQPEDMKDAYIAMSREQGEVMVRLIQENHCTNIVEFGTSFGISTLYLAAGAKETGGKVITTELLPKKCAAAQKNFEEAGAADIIDLREGDAMQTLRDCPADIDFLVLDGWNDLYLPLLKMLEPKFKKGCIVITDNTNFPSAKPFLNYIRNHPNYTSEQLPTDKGGTEKSVWLGNRTL